MTNPEGRFVARAVRRKKLFMVLSIAGVAAAASLALYYGYRRWADPSYPIGVRVALVVLILLNARLNLRQHRYAVALERLTADARSAPRPGRAAGSP